MAPSTVYKNRLDYSIFSWKPAPWTLISGCVDAEVPKSIGIFTYKQWLLSQDMKTKVFQHVQRIIFSVFKVFKFSGFQFYKFFKNIPGSQLLSDIQTFVRDKVNVFVSSDVWESRNYISNDRNTSLKYLYYLFIYFIYNSYYLLQNY